MGDFSERHPSALSEDQSLHELQSLESSQTSFTKFSSVAKSDRHLDLDAVNREAEAEASPKFTDVIDFARFHEDPTVALERRYEKMPPALSPAVVEEFAGFVGRFKDRDDPPEAKDAGPTLSLSLVCAGAGQRVCGRWLRPL